MFVWFSNYFQQIDIKDVLKLEMQERGKMPLKIHTTYGQIGIETYPSKLAIKYHREFSMKNKLPEMKLATGDPELDIDWSKTRYDLGLKSLRHLHQDAVQKNNAAALKAIGKIAQEGDLLSRIEKGDKKIIARLVRENFMDDLFAGNVGLIPKHPPEVSVKMEYPRTELDPAKVEIEKKRVFSEIKGQPGYVDIYLLQPGGVEIKYQGENIDLRA